MPDEVDDEGESDRAKQARVEPTDGWFASFRSRALLIVASAVGAVVFAPTESRVSMALGSVGAVGVAGYTLFRFAPARRFDRDAENREGVAWFVTLLVAVGVHVFGGEIEAPIVGHVARGVRARDATGIRAASAFVLEESYALPARARTYARRGRYGQEAGRCTVVPVLDADRLPDGSVHVWWMRRDEDDAYPDSPEVRVRHAVRVVGAWADDCKRAARRDSHWDPDAIVVRAVADADLHRFDGARGLAEVIGVAWAIQLAAERIAGAVMRSRGVNASSRARRGASR